MATRSIQELVEEFRYYAFEGKDHPEVSMPPNRHNGADPLQHNGSGMDVMEWKVNVKERIEGIYTRGNLPIKDGDNFPGIDRFYGHVEQLRLELKRSDLPSRSMHPERASNRTADFGKNLGTLQRVESDLIELCLKTMEKARQELQPTTWKKELEKRGKLRDDAAGQVHFILSQQTVDFVNQQLINME